MADGFGLKIGVEGEREFKKSLSEINQTFKVLGSEMKLVQSQFDKNDNSVEALTARNTTLNKQIDAQKEKIKHHLFDKQREQRRLKAGRTDQPRQDR